MVVTEYNNGDILILSTDDNMLNTIKLYDPAAKIVKISNEEYDKNKDDLQKLRELLYSRVKD